MARRGSRHVLALALAIAATSFAGLPAAQAHHGPNVFGQIMQMGDGAGNTAAARTNFNIEAILYDTLRFRSGVHPQYNAHLAFGKVLNPPGFDPGSYLAVSLGTDDGLRWAAPQVAFLRDTRTGTNVPFVMSDTQGSFDVTYETGDRPFWVYFRKAGTSIVPPNTAVPNDGTSISHFALAGSADGVHWVEDGDLAQSTTDPVIQAGSWKTKMTGISDVVYNPTGGTTAAACASQPNLCRHHMYYDAEDASGNRKIGVAYSPNLGITWTGYANPALGGGGWDAHTSQGHVVIRSYKTYNPYPGCPATSRIAVLDGSGNLDSCHSTTSSANARLTVLRARLEMYYTGQTTTADPRSIGTALSTDGGKTFTANAAQNPGIVPALLNEHFSGAGSLENPMSVVDAGSVTQGHEKIWFARTVAGQPSSLHYARTAPTPGPGPVVILEHPLDGYVSTAGPEVLAYATDVNGGLIDFQTSTVKIDGAPALGWFVKKTIVTQLEAGFPAYEIRLPKDVLNLSTGTHTLEITVRDYDGNATTVDATFGVDASPPSTTVTTAPVEFATHFFPGQFKGVTVDGDGDPSTTMDSLGLRRVAVHVYNPLNQWKVFDVTTVKAINSERFEWSWTSPGGDPHFLAPGTYRFSFVGEDIAFGKENYDDDNTRFVASFNPIL